MLIGSRAIHFWKESFQPRENADWDVIGEPIFSADRIEKHSFDDLNNRRAVELYNTRDEVCNMKGLALIKRSHLHRDYFFDKHITVYHKWLKPFMINLSEEDKDFLKERTKLTTEKFIRGNPNLKQKNEDFFDDAVEKKYDHDYIHELVAFFDEPIYKSLKRDQSLAWCEKDLWDQCQFKAECVSEEAHVIALERFLIPSEFNMSWKLAYYKAVQKVCTTLTSGWFRDYAIDNYPTVLRLYNQNKLQYVKEKL